MAQMGNDILKLHLMIQVHVDSFYFGINMILLKSVCPLC